MEYNHSRKAGNQGDVWKHAVLVALADIVPASSDAFRYVECHSGAPVHRLRPGGEWERGVGLVARNGSCDCQYATAAKEWLSVHRYPASWVFVTERLAKRFKNVHAALSDVAADVAADYPPASNVHVPANVTVEFRQSDGFAMAACLDEADLVFLDPPFHPNAETDWRMLAGTCQQLAMRGLPFVAWYPFYWPTRPQWLTDLTRCEAWEVSWAACGPKPSQNLKGCGMLISESLVPFLQGAEHELRRVSTCLSSGLEVRRPAVI